MLDWLIIGGGVHGCTIAHSLLRFGSVDHERLGIVDPHPEPLAVWSTRAHNCGMRYLRSPAAHAIVPDFTSLLSWARSRGYDIDRHTIPPYSRPSLELFQAHADAMVEQSRIRSRWITGTAEIVSHAGDRWAVQLAGGRVLETRRLVLAPGSAGLAIPAWAQHSAAAVHVFDPGFDREAAARAAAPVIVGGGITAAHLALFLVARRAAQAQSLGLPPAGPVRLVVRATPGPAAARESAARSTSGFPLRVAQFDSDPCYIGPACMTRFLSTSDPEERRRMLGEARNPGAITPDLARQIERAVARGAIEIIVDDVVGVHSRPDGQASLEGRAHRHETDLIVLATGFADGPPGGRIRASLAEATRTALPVDSHGYPVPDPALQWAPGLFVTGRLAEQELGPSAPNIVGAHNAAKRIVAHLRGTPRTIPAAWRRYAPGSVSSSSDSI